MAPIKEQPSTGGPVSYPKQAGTGGINTGIIPINKGGRPKGSKNKDTLFKELMTHDFQGIAKKDIQKVYRILFDKASQGDMKAIKLILDRVVPVTKAIDLGDIEKGGLKININVSPMEQKPAIEADYAEVVDDVPQNGYISPKTT